eukprot:551676-Amphidinium_carterae.1
MNGGAAVTAAWTWLWTSTRGPFRNRWWLATSATALVVLRCLLDSASVVTTGVAWNTLLHQLVCRSSIRCVGSIRTWLPDQARTSRTCGSIGSKCLGYQTITSLLRLEDRLTTLLPDPYSRRWSTEPVDIMARCTGSMSRPHAWRTG